MDDHLNTKQKQKQHHDRRRRRRRRPPFSFLPFESGEALHALTKRLTLTRAINIGNELIGRATELFHQFIPIGLHGFAMTAPWGEEFDKDGLASRLGVPVGGRQFDCLR